MTVAENVEFGLRIRKTAKDERVVASSYSILRDSARGMRINFQAASNSESPYRARLRMREDLADHH